MDNRDDSATVDLLSLVGVEVFEEDVAEWTDVQIREAENWASAVYLSASDNDLDIPPRPKWLRSTAA